VKVLIDREIPTVTLSSPTNGNYYRLNIDATGTASDVNSINLVQITLDNTNWENLFHLQGFERYVLIDYPCDRPLNGLLTVRIRAFDVTGNRNDIDDWRIILIPKYTTIAMSSPTDCSGCRIRQLR
jgi:hypothetical protein